MILKYFHIDSVGAWSSALCLIHCLATPFLFIVQSCTVTDCCESAPLWWSLLDYLFLVISLIAVYFTTQRTSKRWMKTSFYTSWFLLSGIILNEKLALFPIAEEAIYVPALSLIILHIYNQKYCQCKDDECCVQD